MSGKIEVRPETAPGGSSGSKPPSSGSTPNDLVARTDAPTDEPSGASMALIRVALELTDHEKGALAQALERHFGHSVRLKVEMDSRIIGGVWVQIGDTIIDGSLQGRLEALRHHLRASSRAMILDSRGSGDREGDGV